MYLETKVNNKWNDEHAAPSKTRMRMYAKPFQGNVPEINAKEQAKATIVSAEFVEKDLDANGK